jgi:hypothetical protein
MFRKVSKYLQIFGTSFHQYPVTNGSKRFDIRGNGTNNAGYRVAIGLAWCRLQKGHGARDGFWRSEDYRKFHLLNGGSKECDPNLERVLFIEKELYHRVFEALVRWRYICNRNTKLNGNDETGAFTSLVVLSIPISVLFVVTPVVPFFLFSLSTFSFVFFICSCSYLCLPIQCHFCTYEIVSFVSHLHPAARQFCRSTYTITDNTIK